MGLARARHIQNCVRDTPTLSDSSAGQKRKAATILNAAKPPSSINAGAVPNAVMVQPAKG